MLKMTSEDVFPIFKQHVNFNRKKRIKEINMKDDFFSYHQYYDPSDVGPLNHLYNGELLHDCYYDIEDSNFKLFFFNLFKCFKMNGNNKVLSSPYPYEFSSVFF